jgi:hypothetical protein
MTFAFAGCCFAQKCGKSIEQKSERFFWDGDVFWIGFPVTQSSDQAGNNSTVGIKGRRKQGYDLVKGLTLFPPLQNVGKIRGVF